MRRIGQFCATDLFLWLTGSGRWRRRASLGSTIPWSRRPRHRPSPTRCRGELLARGLPGCGESGTPRAAAAQPRSSPRRRPCGRLTPCRGPLETRTVLQARPGTRQAASLAAATPLPSGMQRGPNSPRVASIRRSQRVRSARARVAFPVHGNDMALPPLGRRTRMSVTTYDEHAENAAQALNFLIRNAVG